MLRILEVVAGDVPKVQMPKLKDILHIRIEVRGGCNGSADQDHHDEQRHFASRKQRPIVAGACEAHVVHDLQHAPDDEQKGPVACNSSPDRDRVSHVSREEKPADDHQRDSPENTSRASAKAHWSSFWLSGFFWPL